MPKQDSPCMFCDELPCMCNKPAVKAKAVRKRKPEATSDIDFSEFAPEPVLRFKPKVVERDWSYESALQALLPILCPEDAESVKQELDKSLPSGIEKALIDWRTRNVHSS